MVHDVDVLVTKASLSWSSVKLQRARSNSRETFSSVSRLDRTSISTIWYIAFYIHDSSNIFFISVFCIYSGENSHSPITSTGRSFILIASTFSCDFLYIFFSLGIFFSFGIFFLLGIFFPLDIFLAGHFLLAWHFSSLDNNFPLAPARLRASCLDFLNFPNFSCAHLHVLSILPVAPLSKIHFEIRNSNTGYERKGTCH